MKSLAAATVAATLFCCAADTYAQDNQAPDSRAYGKFYNGAFVDVAARAALTRVSPADMTGWSWDIALRQALVMHLFDTRLSYSEDRFGHRGGPADDFVARSVQIHTAFHPLYLALLLSDWFGYVLASFYVEAGVGAHFMRSEPVAQSDIGARFSLGAGFDVPVTDPDNGWSIWLNAVYRYNWIDFDYDSGGELNLHHHAGWLGVSLRFNGLLF